MSLSAGAIGEVPIDGQTGSVTSTSVKTPPKRKVTSKADVINQPEAR